MRFKPKYSNKNTFPTISNYYLTKLWSLRGLFKLNELVSHRWFESIPGADFLPKSCLIGLFLCEFYPPKLNIPFKISQNCIHYTVWEIIHYTPEIPFYQLSGGGILFSMGDYSLCVLFIPGVLTVLVLLPRVGQDLVVLSMTCNGWPLHPCMSLPLVSAYRGVSRSSVGLPICIDGSHLSWCRNSSRFFR